MKTKFIEIRDRGTFIPALAILISGADGYLARRAGFGEEPCVYLMTLATEKCSYDPFHWGNRTMTGAHMWIRDHWDRLSDGDVVDVEYLAGESTAPKRSEVFTDPL